MTLIFIGIPHSSSPPPSNLIFKLILYVSLFFTSPHTFLMTSILFKMDQSEKGGFEIVSFFVSYLYCIEIMITCHFCSVDVF